MSVPASTCRSYIVAASMATVEALKDHGFARWNYPLRTLHQRLRSNVKSSLSQSSKASSATVGSEMRKKTVKKTDRIIKKVMELDSWGPSTVRL